MCFYFSLNIQSLFKTVPLPKSVCFQVKNCFGFKKHLLRQMNKIIVDVNTKERPRRLKKVPEKLAVKVFCG